MCHILPWWPTAEPSLGHSGDGMLPNSLFLVSCGLSLPCVNETVTVGWRLITAFGPLCAPYHYITGSPGFSVYLSLSLSLLSLSLSLSRAHVRALHCGEEKVTQVMYYTNFLLYLLYIYIYICMCKGPHLNPTLLLS